MTRTIFIAAALALAATLPAVPAQAQAPRTFVSAAGNDSNPCSFAAPCRHFQAAVDVTSDGGEVDALDPAGYSPITISRGITIEGQGWSYIAPPAGGAAITVNAVTGKVIIRGVSLNGVGVSQAIGIQFNSGASLTVRDSVIQNFTRYGILFQPNGSGNISVSNTAVSDNNYGIYIGPLGSGISGGTLDHVHTENNTSDGITVITGGQDLEVVITESVIGLNGGNGITATTTSNLPAFISVVVRNSIINHNSGFGFGLAGPHTGISVTRSTITANQLSFNTIQGVSSYNDNNILLNGDPDIPGVIAYQ